jgi:hypothetical protein
MRRDACPCLIAARTVAIASLMARRKEAAGHLHLASATIAAGFRR